MQTVPQEGKRTNLHLVCERMLVGDPSRRVAKVEGGGHMASDRQIDLLSGYVLRRRDGELIRVTSRLSYKILLDRNLLGEMQQKILSLMDNAEGAVTVGELMTEYAKKHPHMPKARNEIAKRVTELRDAGLIKEYGKKRCPLTDRLVLAYVLKD
jgi:hypothetical protein